MTRFIPTGVGNSGIFRLPPLLLGDLEETPNKATADTAKEIAEEQVFRPARQRIVDQINMLLADKIITGRGQETGVKYWRLELASLNSDRTETVLKVLKEAREQAAITPNQVQAIIAALLPEFKLEAFDDARNDTPLAYQIIGSKANLAPPAETGEGEPDGDADEDALNDDLKELTGPEAEQAKSVLKNLFGIPAMKIWSYTNAVNDSDSDPAAA